MRYTIETSADMATWQPLESIYGLGHEYVVTMREFTPPPPLPPGTPPAAPVSLPFVSASVRMQPATGAAGGTVISWPALDGSGPVVVRIDANLDPAWSQVPLYARRFDDYSFFVWHPDVAIDPPAENPQLGAADSGVLAALEANLPAMNLEVQNSVAQARNAPPPPPPNPDDRKFWRIYVDATLDTDGDGSPDWAEFEIAAGGTGVLVAGVTADPFAADTNGDGILDGAQMDRDNDGTPDSEDPAPDDATAAFPIGPEPRYGIFPITNADPLHLGNSPIQISDRGTVLYPNGTWAAGIWTPLIAPHGISSGFSARVINDSDTILGVASVKVREDPEEFAGGIWSWSNPQVAPAVVSANAGGATIFASPTEDFATSTNPGPVLDNDGRFFMQTHGWQDANTSSGSIFGYLHLGRWKLPEGQTGALEEPAGGEMRWNRGPDLTWGFRQLTDSNGFVTRKGVVRVPQELPELSFVPANVFASPGKPVMALAEAGVNESAMAYVKGTWTAAPAYAHAIDMSADGTAIGSPLQSKISQICANGKWKTLPLVAPNTAGGWDGEDVEMMDTTPGGWILARRSPILNEYAVLMPIRLDGLNPDYVTPPVPPDATPPEPPEYLSGGVDRTSTTAVGGTGRLYENWIMAPKGSEGNNVRIRAPLNAKSKLTLISPGNHVGFTPELLVNPVTTVKFAGIDPESGDHRIDLRLGDAGGGGEQLKSLSFPIKVKVMKRRTVKIAVHKVVGSDEHGNQTTPANYPTPALEALFETSLETYLNKVYGRQTNTFFDATLFEEKGPDQTGIDFDFEGGNNDVKLNVSAAPAAGSELAKATPNPKSGVENATANIDIWVIGGGVRLMLAGKPVYGAHFGGAGEGKCIIDGDLLGETGLIANRLLLHVFAHEIGHVLTGDGHPDEGTGVAVLNWKTDLGIAVNRADPRDKDRLMCSGKNMNLLYPGSQLVKKEWDAIEAWLKLKKIGETLLPPQ